MAALTEKYRPQTLADLLGQPWVIDQLRAFLEMPHSVAFLFSGPTGTGKTSAALALAAELGIKVERGEYSGLWQIASGEQTGQTVHDIMDKLRVTPWEGSGWRMLIVNEADCMTANAAYIWLDKLENIPPRTVVVFTTNDAKRLPQRLRDRCETLDFDGGALFLRPALQELVDRIWRQERFPGPAPEVEDLGELTDGDGNASFRRTLQRLTLAMRPSGIKSPPKATPAEKPASNVATTIRARREARGMTRSQLALALQISNVHLSKIETGRRPARPELLRRIDRVLEEAAA